MIHTQQEEYLADKSQYVNFCAATSYPNTSETDQQLFVWHTVNYTEITSNGVRIRREIDVMASDPMCAIEQVHEQLTNQ